MTYADDAAAIRRASELVREVLSRRQPARATVLLEEAHRRLVSGVEYLQGRAENADREGAKGRFLALPEAVVQWQEISGAPTAGQALEGLIDTCDLATYRATDRVGRELWRAPRSARGVRLVVDPRPSWAAETGETAPRARLPVVLWVGRSRPPSWCWAPR